MIPPPLERRGKVTRTVVAQRAGVSTAVVSYVLNNGPRPVAEGTKRRVLAAIDELGYRPNSVARALKTQRTHTLGLLVPDNSNPYFAELGKAIEHEAYGRGYAILLGNSDNNVERESFQLAALTDRRVDGLLLIGIQGNPSSEVDFGDTPVIYLDRFDASGSQSSVVVDNEDGARQGVRHLLGHGHRRILCLAGPAHLQAAEARLAGWRIELEHAGIDTRDLVVRTDFTRLAGYEATREILAGANRPTAIFASSDLQGVGALRACHDAGLRVPEDVAVLSFDGTQESEYTSPPLSVVQQDIPALAKAAVELILRQHNGSAVEQLTMPCSLLIRQSCGC